MKTIEVLNISQFPKLLGFTLVYTVLAGLLVMAFSTPDKLSLLFIVFFVMLSSLYFVEPAYFTISIILFIMLRNNILGNVVKHIYNGQELSNIDAIILGYLFFLVFFGTLIRGNRFRLGPKRLLIPMGLVMGLGIISGLAHRVPLFILLHGTYFTMKGFILYLIFTNMHISDYERYCRKLTHGVFFLSLIVLIGIVPNLIYPKEMGIIVGLNIDSELEMRWFLPSVHSIFSHPHRFCFFMGFVLFLFFSKAMVQHHKEALIGMIGAFIGIFLSMRRTELVASIISLGSVLLMRIEGISLKKKLLVPLILVMLIVPAGGYLRTQFDIMTARIDLKNIDSVARIALYVGSVFLANKDFPMGEGFGRFASLTAARYYSPVYREIGLNNVVGLEENSVQYHKNLSTDTFYPHIIGETGWIGLFCFLLFLIFTVMIIKKIHNEIPQSYPYLKILSLTSYCYFIYISLLGVVSFVFEEPLSQILSYGSLGILINYYQSQSMDHTKS
jgi:hypothetical protein